MYRIWSNCRGNVCWASVDSTGATQTMVTVKWCIRYWVQSKLMLATSIFAPINPENVNLFDEICVYHVAIRCVHTACWCKASTTHRTKRHHHMNDTCMRKGSCYILRFTSSFTIIFGMLFCELRKFNYQSMNVKWLVPWFRWSEFEYSQLDACSTHIFIFSLSFFLNFQCY